MKQRFKEERGGLLGRSMDQDRGKSGGARVVLPVVFAGRRWAEAEGVRTPAWL